jgi:hypothetical protein
MRIMLIVLATVCSAAAFAQSSPPAAESKPPAQVKPHATAKPTSIAGKLQACLEIDDGTKGRLDCYDAVIAPKPKPPVAKGVMDCRYFKEEDERLGCFNGFAESVPKFS